MRGVIYSALGLSLFVVFALASTSIGGALRPSVDAVLVMGLCVRWLLARWA